MGLEPTRTYCPTDFLATLCFHSQNFPYPTHAYMLSTTIFVTAAFYISGRCCLRFVGFNSMFVLLQSGLSLYHIRNVATQESNFDMSPFQLTVNVLSIILHSIPISNLGITRSVSTRLLEYPSCNLMHHTFYSNRRYLSYPFQPYETSLIPIFARYSPYTLLISVGTF